MDDKKVPRVVIVVENGVVSGVLSNTDVEFVVLDNDELKSEDVVAVMQLAKTMPKYTPAFMVGELGLNNRRSHFKEEAKRQLRSLIE